MDGEDYQLSFRISSKSFFLSPTEHFHIIPGPSHSNRGCEGLKGEENTFIK